MIVGIFIVPDQVTEQSLLLCDPFSEPRFFLQWSTDPDYFFPHTHDLWVPAFAPALGLRLHQPRRSRQQAGKCLRVVTLPEDDYHV